MARLDASAAEVWLLDSRQRPVLRGIEACWNRLTAGTHKGAGVYAFSNRTPRAASWSRFGI